jgi:hypothetical protein
MHNQGHLQVALLGRHSSMIRPLKFSSGLDLMKKQLTCTYQVFVEFGTDPTTLTNKLF